MYHNYFDCNIATPQRISMPCLKVLVGLIQDFHQVEGGEGGRLSNWPIKESEDYSNISRARRKRIIYSTC